MDAALDHLIVAVHDLATAANALEEEWGTTLSAGGRHTAMGTHNRLTRIGPSAYLEVIAIDPDGTAPLGPRWFGLDEPDMRERLRSGPVLVGWALRVRDLGRALAACPMPLVRAVPMSRGALTWRIALPEDGRPVEGGTAPYLIEWPDGEGPAHSIPRGELALADLVLHHPEPARLRSMLDAWGASGPVTVQAGEAAAPRAVLLGRHGREIRLG